VNCWPFKPKGKKFLGLLRLVGRGESQRFSEFTELFAQLRSAELDLEEASVTLEKQFLDTGSELETLTGFGARFVEQVEKLIGLATGKECDGSVFSNAIQLIERSTQFLVNCHDETTRMLALLRGYSAQIEHLLSVENDLQRTMMPLKFVQTLFKAESAPLGESVQRTFTALTQEIEALNGQVREIFGTKFKQLEQTHRTIGNVIEQLDRQALALQLATTTHKAQIESSLDKLKKEMVLNKDRDARLGSLSKALRREVDQVVMGLQFEDIVRQKIEHVRAALPQMETKFGEFKASLPTAGIEPLQFLHQSCLLEAEQLQGAQTEFSRAEGAIQGGIQKVLSQLLEMDSQCLSLDEFKLLTTSFDGMVQVLVEMIEEVRGLVATTVASATEAYEMLRPLGSLASDLTVRVRNVSNQIHLIGLNAQVQAARGAQDRRGAGLEVLSIWTSEISDETNRASRNAAEELDRLAAGLAENVRILGELKAKGLAQQTLLSQRGQSEEQELHGFRDSALETLRDIGDSLDAIREKAHSTLAKIQFAEFHQVTIPALRTPLVAIAAASGRWLEARRSDLAQTNLIEGLKRDYTMASEREVFAGVLAAQGLAAKTVVSAGPAAADSSVEIFVDGSAGSGEDVPDEKQEAPLVTADVAAGGGEFGANVEMF
jgi:hypothetical protein